MEFIFSRAFNINGPPGKLSGVCVSDTASVLTAAQTTVTGTTVHAKAFETTPTRAAQTSTCKTLYGTGDANFVHKVITLVGGTASLPDTSSPVPGFYGGIDSLQSVGISKTSSFSLRHIVNQTFVNIGTGGNLWVNQALQLLIDNLYDISPLNASKFLSMGFDDGASAYVAADTTFTGATAAISILFDATPTGATGGGTPVTVTAIGTIPKGGAGNNMNAKSIKRMNINTQVGTVAQTAGAISGLGPGVSFTANPIRKELDYSLKWTVVSTASSA